VHHSFDSIVENDSGDIGPSWSRSALQYSAKAIDNFLAQVTSHDAPNHELHLKVGVVCSITTLVHEKHTQIVDHLRHDTIPRWVKLDETFDGSNLMDE
jgi:hypothetical protein